jgi:anti-sigma28 factor (negative regulator of flagellin synthesis)
MEIRNNASGSNGSERIDFTRSIRETIRERNPIPPPATKPPPPADVPVDPKRIKNARAIFSVAKRVHEARERYQETQATDTLSVSPEAADMVNSKADRTRRVEELKAQHESGRLDVNSMVAEAAYRMLSSD